MQSFRISVTRSEAEDLYTAEIEVLTLQEVISGNRITWRRTSHKSIFTSPISPYSNFIEIKLAKSN